MKIRVFALTAALAALVAAACDKKASRETASAPPPAAADAAPDVYKVRFSTTKGDMIVEVRRAWAPRGADRFHALVRSGFYDDTAFFRVIDGFMAQTGIHGDPAVAARWRGAAIPDDPPAGQSNRRGMVTFATAGPDTRTTQIFFNFRDNSMLDGQGFVPFGKVIEGEGVLDSLYRGYGEGLPLGSGPEQGRLQAEGSAYLKAEFPKLDYTKTARLVP
ncbi:MAG: peptidylprolyl isomerase [Elusimicrobia bacterium]|nr:peptidylprolyl isomerase [Elusimicrobiota bacterium]